MISSRKIQRKKPKPFTKVSGQLMLWRSGFGCDLVEYIMDNPNQYYCCKVRMLTGILNGSVSSLQENELADTTKEIYERYRKINFKKG